MDKIKHYFKTIVDISEIEYQLFYSKLKKKSFSKKTIILEKGKVENFLSFIEEGIIRYNIPKLDYDFTFGFAFEGSFVSAYDSFLTRLPSTYNIETITNTIVWQISYKDLNTIYEDTIIGDRIGRKIIENIYLKKIKREISLLEYTAKKRYLDLLKEQPQLIEKIPLKYLASYIGIKPQSLSRIRREIY